MPQPVALAVNAMGTRFELVLIGADEGRLRAAGEAAIEEIRHWHERLSWFDAGSFVSHINARAAAGPVTCDPDIFSLLELCAEVWRASDGTFDPTVAALMRASGFRDVPRDDEAIARARAATGFEHVELDARARTIRFAKPGIGIDLGAIGKGWALDGASEVIREAGVDCALLHGGTSSVIAIGTPAGGDGWAVKLGNGPDDPAVLLRDLSLGVSAPSGRVVRAGPGGVGSDHGHVLDPRTGRSARGLSIAGVIGASCARADAWSTAVLVEQARAPGMPREMTALLGPADDDGGPWRIDGPHAAILIRR